MKTTLIKARIVLETEIVVDNYYGDDSCRAARSAFLGHHNEIIDQALESNEVTITATEITCPEDLPKNWTGECLPWLPGITYGDTKQIRKIKDFFKKKRVLKSIDKSTKVK